MKSRFNPLQVPKTERVPGAQKDGLIQPRRLEHAAEHGHLGLGVALVLMDMRRERARRHVDIVRHEQDQWRARLVDAEVLGVAGPAVVVTEVGEREGKLRARLGDYLARVIRGAVVDHDHLVASRVELLLSKMSQGLLERVRAVVSGEHYAQSQLLVHRCSRQLLSRPSDRVASLCPCAPREAASRSVLGRVATRSA
jgi:hypothetical protein